MDSGQLRAFVLRRTQNHQHPGSGSHWDPVHYREISTPQLSEWSWISQPLNDIRYAIIGRLATNQYAPPQWPIEGIEIAVSSRDVCEASRRVERYQSEGNQSEGNQNQGNQNQGNQNQGNQNQGNQNQNQVNVMGWMRIGLTRHCLSRTS